MEILDLWRKNSLEMYQDIYSNGEITAEGIRGCSDRYEALKTVFSKFNRPFSVLDIGANFGYFSIRAAEDFGATCVMVQPQPESEKLQVLCEENRGLKLTLLDRRVTGEDLRKLAQCERFDVVLALNVLHHVPSDWQLGAEAIMDMGDIIIFESPPPEDKGACGSELLIKSILDFFNSREHEELGLFSRHTDPDAKSRMIKLNGTKKPLEKSYWEQEGDNLNGECLGCVITDDGRPIKVPKGISVSSDFEERKVTKLYTGETYDWINGINLRTFLQLNGIYPSREEIKNKVGDREVTTTYTWDNTHGDITPWNFILDGSSLHLIDVGHKDHWPTAGQWTVRSDNWGIDFTVAQIDLGADGLPNVGAPVFEWKGERLGEHKAPE